MPHQTGLIATVVAALGVAFVLGVAAARLGLPPLVGYLVAGIVIGPFTPGFVADAALAAQLAELGVVLLMFGVGLHFSVRDLGAVRGTAVPGALGQIAITGTIGATLARAWGWSWGGAAVLGLALAVASTVVVIKGLEARDRLDSPEGRLAVGWLVVEDLAMVVALVLLPALAPLLAAPAGEGAGAAPAPVLAPLALALGKVAGFVALMLLVGRRALPWLLGQVARLGSRELFTLAVLVTALGVGMLASEVFGISFALGAFFAGAVVSESELSQRAAEDALPLQDAFAVLFFVAVGMLFDPRAVAERPGQVAAAVAVIMLGKTAAAYTLVRRLGQPPAVAAAIAASLAQIGEFSFIVSALGLSLGLLPPGGQGVVVAAALISVTLNGPWSALMGRVARRASAGDDEAPFDFSGLSGHVVVIGYGRVGRTIARALERTGAHHVIVDEQARIVEGERRRGASAVHGDATRPAVLRRAGIAGARLIVVTVPEPIHARRVVELVRRERPGVAVAVRTHSEGEQAYLERYLRGAGADAGAGGAGVAPWRVVYAERETALSLAHYALLALGHSDDTADAVVDALRDLPPVPEAPHAPPPHAEPAADGAGPRPGEADERALQER